jgi:acyl carrier protein
VNAQQAFEAVRDAVVEVMEVDPAAVTRESRLVEDLRCDSLALCEIAEIVEELVPGLTIDDRDLDNMKTVGDAADYVAVRA